MHEVMTARGVRPLGRLRHVQLRLWDGTYEYAYISESPLLTIFTSTVRDCEFNRYGDLVEVATTTWEVFEGTFPDAEVVIDFGFRYPDPPGRRVLHMYC